MTTLGGPLRQAGFMLGILSFSCMLIISLVFRLSRLYKIFYLIPENLCVILLRDHLHHEFNLVKGISLMTINYSSFNSNLPFSDSFIGHSVSVSPETF